MKQKIQNKISLKEEILQKLASFERFEQKIFVIVINSYHEKILKENFEKDGILNEKGSLFGIDLIIDDDIEEIQFLTREEMLKRQEKVLRKNSRVKTRRTILKEKIEKVTKEKI
jgi:hypothetical protein